MAPPTQQRRAGQASAGSAAATGAGRSERTRSESGTPLPRLLQPPPIPPAMIHGDTGSNRCSNPLLVVGRGGLVVGAGPRRPRQLLGRAYDDQAVAAGQL